MNLEYKEKFRIGVYGEIEEVYINFFINQEIIEENKIGDTYFIRIKNGKENLTYSIHQNYYDKVQSSIRDWKLEKILKD
jgi:hypothetical protein